MSNKDLPPPYISEPPVFDDLIGGDKGTNPTWIDWFNSVTRVTGYCIIHDSLVDTSALTRRDAVLLLAPSYTTVERNQLENNQLKTGRAGVIIYNTTSKQFEFRVEVTPATAPPTYQWVTFAPVPA